MDYSYGLAGIIILTLDIWAILNVFASKEPNVNKLFWIVLIIILPAIGAIAWALVGPRSL